MKIAVDKNSFDVVKDDGNEYIYLFNYESYDELKQLNMHCIYYKDCEYVDIDLTDYDINCFSKRKKTDQDWDKLPEKKDYKFGIIVPNYNYEHTIDKCLTSLMNQTYKNYEVIFIDDVSTDNSVAIANSYVDKLPCIKIIQLKQKRLNGGARNEGYLHLSDDVDYVMYVDSDDWLQDEHVIEKINNRLQKHPDVLFIGLGQFKNNKTTTAFIPQYKDKYQAMEGWSGSCGKVIRKNLATRQECLYSEGTLKEDKNQHCRICIYMKSFELLKEPLYIWNRQNMKSVTTVRDKTDWGTSTIRQYADTLQLYLREKDKDPKIDSIMIKRVAMCKNEMLNEGDKQW